MSTSSLARSLTVLAVALFLGAAYLIVFAPPTAPAGAGIGGCIGNGLSALGGAALLRRLA